MATMAISTFPFCECKCMAFCLFSQIFLYFFDKEDLYTPQNWQLYDGQSYQYVCPISPFWETGIG